MRGSRTIPNWRFLAAVGLLVCLLALLAHPAHMLSAAAMLLLPVLFLGLLPVLRAIRLRGGSEPTGKTRQLARATLFQRPPPRFSR